MIEFRKVRDRADISSVAKLAYEIWNQHFVSIIGQAQVDYMLEKFQSAAAVTQQLENGYEYFIVSSNENSVGYVGLVPETGSGRMMISKFYVAKQARGSGVGGRALEFVKKISRDRGFDTIWLTVNRHNETAIGWYLRKGFVIVDEVKNDIGKGFFMDDYVMELVIR